MGETSGSAGNGGKRPGRTGAYGADPSGASANVSVSVSAGRTRVRTGPISSRKLQAAPVPSYLSLSPPSPSRPVAFAGRRFCWQGRRATLSRPSTQVYRQAAGAAAVFATRRSGGFRWGSPASGTKKRQGRRGTGCTIGHRVSVRLPERLLACLHETHGDKRDEFR